jgi:hypothetical protein
VAGVLRRRLALVSEPRLLRSRWLAALSRAADWYLRSPIFLTGMRYTLGAAIEAQALQANGFTHLLPRRRHRR